LNRHLWQWLAFFFPLVVGGILVQLNLFPNLYRFIPWLYFGAWAIMLGIQLNRVEGKVDALLKKLDKS
jgi:hypothetical protein